MPGSTPMTKQVLERYGEPLSKNPLIVDSELSESDQLTNDEVDPSIYEVSMEKPEGMLISLSILYQRFHYKFFAVCRRKDDKGSGKSNPCANNLVGSLAADINRDRK